MQQLNKCRVTCKNVIIHLGCLKICSEVVYLENDALPYSVVFLAGTEAGGEDALVGNVSKLVVSPPGYTGAPRKGHLTFDACFESGEESFVLR